MNGQKTNDCPECGADLTLAGCERMDCPQAAHLAPMPDGQRTAGRLGRFLCRIGWHRWEWWGPNVQARGDTTCMDCARCGINREDYEEGSANA